MKNIYSYYFCIISPLLLLFLSTRYSSLAFVIGLLIYAAIYRTITDGLRLVNKGKMNKKDIWKLLLPFSRLKYFKDLYLTDKS